MRSAISVSIDSFGADGSGSGLDPRGRRWSVRGAAPGSVVSVGGRPKSGILLDVLQPATDAVAPRCRQFGLCGGCQWQHMPIGRQRSEKAVALARLLEPLGGVDHGIDGAGAWGYRNKIELSFGSARYLSKPDLDAGVPRAGRFLGMHAPGRFDRVVDTPRCDLVSDVMNAVLARVRDDVLASPWPLWDPAVHTGFWRHILLREGRGGVLVGVFTTPGDDEQAAWLAQHAPGWGAAGVSWFENDRPADAAIGTRRAVLHGVEYVTEELAGLRYRLSPLAFFQVNPEGAELLCQRVAAAAGSGDLLVDLYCGTGALGLACARNFRRVVGIDSNPASIEDARANAAQNGVDAVFLAGEVERRFAELPITARPTVIVDPPRVGLHPSALGFVAGLDAEVLVYVACKPASLLRDGQQLRAAGWRCTDRWAIDLFPHTGHVEVVSSWTRT